APGGAEQREELALINGQGQVVNGGEVAELLGDVLEDDIGLRRRVGPRREAPANAAKRFHLEVPRPDPALEGTMPAFDADIAGSAVYWPVTTLVHSRVTTRWVRVS